MTYDSRVVRQAAKFMGFRRLGEHARPLSFYVEFTLANHREPESQKRLADAVTEYVASKKQEFNQGYLSRSQMGRIEWDLKRLNTYFPKKSVAELTVPNLVAFEAPWLQGDPLCICCALVHPDRCRRAAVYSCAS